MQTLIVGDPQRLRPMLDDVLAGLGARSEPPAGIDRARSLLAARSWPLIVIDPALPAADVERLCRDAHAPLRQPPSLVATIAPPDDPRLPALVAAGLDEVLPAERGPALEVRTALLARRLLPAVPHAAGEEHRTVAWLDAVFNEARDALFITDEAGRFVDVNRAACTLTGYSREELLRMRIPDLHREVDLEAFRSFHHRILAGEEVVTEAPILRKDGTTVETEFNNRRLLADGVPYMHTVARDITERRRAEAARRQLEPRVQHIQKLESLGILAGGVAHDFNNLLVSILGNAGIALMDLPADAPLRPNLREIERAAQRASDLTRQMLAYSGRGHFLLQKLDLTRIVEQMEALLRSLLPPDGTLALRLAPDLPRVLGDASQLGQLVMNLVSNAVDALPKEAGRVRISTSAVQADRGLLAATYLDEGLPEGGYVELQVCDNGCGMDAATRARIFDPFFSTKFPGRGLGLAAVLGIVRGHRGAIKVDSEAGAGTTVSVLLPNAAGAEACPETRAPQRRESGSRRLVLIVDDNSAVAHVASRMLQRAGFDTRVSTRGADAIEIVTADAAGEVSAVLLDLLMPGMDGREVLVQLRRIRPTLPVLLSSGDVGMLGEDLSGPGIGFLQKPYQPSQLAFRIEELIRQTGEGG